MGDDFKTILNASYKPQAQAKQDLEDKGYTYDKDLSTMNSKVFVDKDGNANIVYRGSTRVSDWFKNPLIAVGLQKYDPDFIKAKQLAKDVSIKYNSKPNVYGHSRGGSIAEFVGKDAKNINTYNKGAGVNTIGKKVAKNQHDYRARFDPISIIGTTQKGNITTLSSSINPFKAHSTRINFSQ